VFLQTQCHQATLLMARNQRCTGAVTSSGLNFTSRIMKRHRQDNTGRKKHSRTWHSYWPPKHVHDVKKWRPLCVSWQIPLGPQGSPANTQGCVRISNDTITSSTRHNSTELQIIINTYFITLICISTKY